MLKEETVKIFFMLLYLGHVVCFYYRALFNNIVTCE